MKQRVLLISLIIFSIPFFALNTKAVEDEQVPAAAEPVECAVGFDPASIMSGAGTALWWWTDGADTVAFENSIDTGNKPAGFVWIHPEKSATYVLKAIGPGGEATCTTELEVKPKKPSCDIGIGYMRPDTKQIDFNEEITIWWQTDGAKMALINNGIGSVRAPEGYVRVRPTEDMTYELKVFNEAGESTCSVDVRPQVVHQCFGSSISRNQVIRKGEEALLEWNLTPFVLKTEIDNGIGEVTVHRSDQIGINNSWGYVAVSPEESTTYTLTASGFDAEITCPMTVEVID